jgi:hypothetical protein
VFRRLQRSPIIRSGSSRKAHRVKTATLAVTAIVACGALATTAAAVLTASSGGTQITMDNAGETAAAPAPGMAWANLPGSDINVNGDSVINARFTAESTCNGEGAGACVVRIIAVNAAGVTPLDPASGNDFAFDTDVPGGVDFDLAEGHAMERSRRLADGPYVIRVQYAVTNPATAFRLDDWHFAVETST